MAIKKLIYHLWPLSWGKIRTMTAFLPRIKALGADYVWLSPIFSSPLKNSGYDISDYYSINSRLGTIEDFEEFMSTAHTLDLKVILEIVIDSTSTSHPWFKQDPSKYIWAKEPSLDYQNLVDQDTAWEYYPKRGEYYLHLNLSSQADLNWWPGGVVNRNLVRYFKDVMYYWASKYDVDGFKIGSVESLNKNISQDMHFHKLLKDKRATTILNELTNVYSKTAPYIIMECIDNTGSEIAYYEKETDVECISNTILKSMAAFHKGNTLDYINKYAKDSRFLLELESPNSPRFTSRSEMSGKAVINMMFNSEATNIVLYQGQELGLTNPTADELSIADMLSLDAKSASCIEKNIIAPESLRQNSCANCRLPIPMEEYALQEKNENSTLNLTKTAIQKWKAY
ncbi:hypothetical protein IJ076_01030 [Candidatus Saccharibacteria bacterium]|nr:hypothetical protein [Candidatus Saccharibacteria bacterium]